METILWDRAIHWPFCGSALSVNSVRGDAIFFD
jgi:hypothetical protein